MRLGRCVEVTLQMHVIRIVVLAPFNETDQYRFRA